MIIVANERAHGAELARHLLNPRDNDHVTVHAIDGFVADDLFGAFAEAEAISAATRCQKYLVSLSFNPPGDAEVSVAAFEDTITRTERLLGLEGQPRAIVFHEKNGRRHAHVVWSKIDTAEMKAINLSHYKRKLTGLSRELYREFGWDMPDGFKRVEDRDPYQFDRVEAAQAAKVKADPRELKALFRAAWAQSDSAAAFAAALKEYGFILARGERRGFVAVGASGKVWSLSRWCGVKPRELRRKIGDRAGLPDIETARALARGLAPLQSKPVDPGFALKREQLVARQRRERSDLLAAQKKREEEAALARCPSALRKVFLKLTCQWDGFVRKAEAETATMRKAADVERQALITRHLSERRALDVEMRRYGVARNDIAYAASQQPLVRTDQSELPSRAALLFDPALILTHLSHTEADFSRTDVLRALAKRIDDPQTLSRLADSALQSSEAVRLPGDGAAQRYTTRDYQTAEMRLVASAQEMAGRGGHTVQARHVKAALSDQNTKMQRAFGVNLSDEQHKAIRHVLGDAQLAQVVGLAGAGKSTMLATAADAWRRQGVVVHGAALAGKAADGLEEAAGIPSRTLASLELSWQNGHAPIAKGDVLVVDEAGMIGTRQMQRVTAKCQEIGAKLVLIGDPEQLQPIEAGTPFHDIVDRQGAARLETVYRQRDKRDRDATRLLADGQTPEALQTYEQRGQVRRGATVGDAIDALAETYAMEALVHPDQHRLALAHRRKDVHALNLAIRERLRDETALPDTHLQTTTGPRAFASGDRLVFGRNNRDLGVKNGMLGTIEAVSDTKLSVRLDGDDKTRVTFDPREYRDFDLGYAVTIHKSQGATVDQAYVLVSRSMDRHLAYVAMTRHRDDLRVFIAREDRPTWARGQSRAPDRPRDGPRRDGPRIG